MSSRSILLDSHTKKESWNDGTQEIYCQAEERKRYQYNEIEYFVLSIFFLKGS